MKTCSKTHTLMLVWQLDVGMTTHLNTHWKTSDRSYTLTLAWKHIVKPIPRCWYDNLILVWQHVSTLIEKLVIDPTPWHWHGNMQWNPYLDVGMTTRLNTHRKTSDRSYILTMAWKHVVKSIPWCWHDWQQPHAVPGKFQPPGWHSWRPCAADCYLNSTTPLN